MTLASDTKTKIVECSNLNVEGKSTKEIMFQGCQMSTYSMPQDIPELPLYRMGWSRVAATASAGVHKFTTPTSRLAAGVGLQLAGCKRDAPAKSRQETQEAARLQGSQCWLIQPVH